MSHHSACLERWFVICALAVLGALAGAACVQPERAFAPAPCTPPSILGASAIPGEANVLSAVISVVVSSADSVLARYGTLGSALTVVTPAAQVNGDSARVIVLGLHAGTEYAVQVVAFNSCATAAGTPLQFATGEPPADLPHYVASGSSPSPGYVTFSAGGYGIVIDNTGRVVWYHRFPNGPGLNFQPQPNGRYVARPAPAPGQVASWVEVDVMGRVTRTLGCADGLAARMHDMIAQPDGSYWLLCDEVRTVSLPSGEGSADVQVLGTAIQHVSESGDLLFAWSPFDHFHIDAAELQAAERVGGVVNWTHGNALDLDADGNLLVSFRNLSEITKIDARTGNVMWRMGGQHNEFTFEDGAAAPFRRQHGVRSLGAGRLALLDNLGDPAASRVHQIELNEAQRTARVPVTYSSPARVVGPLGGNVQPLPGGRTLVSFGNGAAVEEFDAAGQLVWRIDGDPGYVFRAQRIASLYRPGIGDPR